MMFDNEFKAGDVVQLKSGGPTMTVQTLGRNGFDEEKAWCIWFDGKETKEQTFSPSVLKH